MRSTVQADPRSSPNSRARRWPLVFVAGVAALLAALPTRPVEDALARTIAATATLATGEDVVIGGLDIGLFPPVASVRDARVIHPATRELVARVQEIRATPTLRGTRGLAIGTLTVRGADVLVHIEDDGLREFRALATGGSTSETLPWDRLEVQDTDVAVAMGARQLRLRGLEVAPAAGGLLDLRLDRVELDMPGGVQVSEDVRVPGIVARVDRVAVPRLELRFPDLWLRAGLDLSDEQVLSGDLQVRASLANLVGPVPRPACSGEVEIDGVLQGTLDEPVLRGTLATRNLVLGADGTPRIGDARAEWRLHRAPDGEANLVINDGRLVWGRGEVGVNATIALPSSTTRATVTTSGVHLADVLADAGVHEAPWVDFAGTLDAAVTGTLSPFRLGGRLALDADDLRVTNGPTRSSRSELVLGVDRVRLEGAMEVDARALEIDVAALEARSRGARVSRGSATAYVGFDAPNEVRVDVDLARVDLAQLAPLGDVELTGVATVDGRFVGSAAEGFGASAAIEVDDLGVLGFPLADHASGVLDAPELTRLDFHDIVARIGATDWSGAYVIDLAPDDAWMSLDVDVPDGRLRDLIAIVEPIDGIDGSATLRARLAGTGTGLNGRVDGSFREVRLWGERFDGGAGVGWFDDGLFTLDGLRLEREGRDDRREVLLARGSMGPAWAYNLDATWDGASLQRMDGLAGLPLTGQVVAHAHLGGDLDDPRPDATLLLADVSWDGTRLGTGRLRLTPERGHARLAGTLADGALAVTGDIGVGEGAPWELRVEAKHAPVQALWPKAMDGAAIRATVDGTLALTGTADGLATAEATIDAAEASWRGAELRLAAPTRARWTPARYALDATRIEGSGGTALLVRGASDAPEGFEGTGRVDLALLPAFVPGILEAEGAGALRLTTPRAATGELAPTLSLDVRDARARTDLFPEAFEEVTASLVATPSTFDLPSFEARVGGGRLRTRAAHVDADDWVPTRYAVAVEVDGATVGWFDDLPPVTGNARLRLDGPADALVLSGRVDVTAMPFTERIDWESMVVALREERLTAAAPDETGRYFALDLDVNADDSVRLRDNVADATARARLRVVGDTQRPGVTGTVAILPGGRAFLHERTFDIVRAEVRYIDPYSYDPELDVHLETTVRSGETDYRVRYGVTGPFSDWRTETSADPYLSQADVNALLLFGTTRAELDRYGGLGAAIAAETGDLLLAQTAIGRLDGIVDRWSLVSGASERGSTTVSSELRLLAEKQFGEVTLTGETALGAGLGNDWYASAERRMAERLYVRTYVATRQEGRALPIGAAYGTEFKVRWELDLQ